jgi:hypothetical protein
MISNNSPSSKQATSALVDMATSATAVTSRPKAMAKSANGNHKANARAKDLGAAMPDMTRTAEAEARDSGAGVARPRWVSSFEIYLERVGFGLYIIYFSVLDLCDRLEGRPRHEILLSRRMSPQDLSSDLDDAVMGLRLFCGWRTASLFVSYDSHFRSLRLPVFGRMISSGQHNSASSF